MTEKREDGRQSGTRNNGLKDIDKDLLEEVSDKCDVEVCERFLAEGADVNAEDEDGCTPLLWAVLSGDHNSVEMFIAKGADVNCMNDEQETPLHWAATAGNLPIAELLISKGAQVNVKDKFGITPLRSASLNEDQQMIELLRRFGGTEE